VTIIEFHASLHGIERGLRADIEHVLHIISAHQGRELRESGEPLLEHPCDVMRQLLDHGFPNRVVVAGGLHDILEDTADEPTPVTYETLIEEFGQEVAEMVWGVTKRPKAAFVTKDERLAEFHERFRQMVRRIYYTVFIKVDDRLHNLWTLHGLERKDPAKVCRIATETLEFYVPYVRGEAKESVPSGLHPVLDRYADKMDLLAKSSLIIISNPTVPTPVP
jgi:GTP diphosphokinase / guanosine-3',5'-bis(diphosphate) 3'-diphosphatase